MQALATRLRQAAVELHEALQPGSSAEAVPTLLHGDFKTANLFMHPTGKLAQSTLKTISLVAGRYSTGTGSYNTAAMAAGETWGGHSISATPLTMAGGHAMCMARLQVSLLLVTCLILVGHHRLMLSTCFPESNRCWWLRRPSRGLANDVTMTGSTVLNLSRTLATMRMDVPMCVYLGLLAGGRF